MQIDIGPRPNPAGMPNLKPYERAARMFCQKSGLNPDATVELQHETFHGATISTTQWELVAERMYDLSLLMVSMREAQVEREALCGTEVKDA